MKLKIYFIEFLPYKTHQQRNQQQTLIFFLIPSILKPFFSYKFFAVLLQHSTVSSKRTILFVLAHKSKLLKKVVPIPFPLYFLRYL